MKAQPRENLLSATRATEPSCLGRSLLLADCSRAQSRALRLGFGAGTA